MNSRQIEDVLQGAQLLVGGPPALDGMWTIVDPLPFLRVIDVTTGNTHTYRKESLSHTTLPLPQVYMYDALRRSEGLDLLRRGYRQPPPTTHSESDLRPQPDDVLSVIQGLHAVAEQELLTARRRCAEQLHTVGRLMRHDRLSRNLSVPQLLDELRMSADTLRDLEAGVITWNAEQLCRYAALVRGLNPDVSNLT
jgi:hypothetical protein